MILLAETLFQHRVPAQVLAAVLAIGLLLLLLTTWRFIERRLLGLLLGLVRVAFLAVLAWCLLLPVQRLVEREQLKPRFLVAADVSASMGLKATRAKDARWDVARQVLEMPWRDPVAARAEIELYTFDQALSPMRPEAEWDALAPGTGGTALKENIARLMQRYRGQPVAGILLLSDGIDVQDPAPGWPEIEWPGPVYAVQLEPPGLWDVAADLRVESVDTPRRVITGWESKLTAVVAGQGTGGQMVPVQVYRDGQLLEEQAVQIPGDGGAREVSFRLSHAAAGTYNFTARVPVLPGETSTNDNEYTVTVQVVDKANRLLYVEGIPRWESKYLNRALQGLRDMAAVSFLRGPDGRFLTFGARGTMDLQLTADQLATFRIVVLGDLEANALGPERVDALRKYVETGGSLVLLGGPAGWSARGFPSTGLKEISPVRFDGLVRAREGRFELTVTEEGRAHPAFTAEGVTWSNLPPVLSVFGGGRLAPAASALVTARSPEGDAPVVAWHRFGQGKVVAILTDSLWRWKLSPDVREPYDRFWNQLVGWLTPAQEQLAPFEVEVFAGADQFYISEPVKLRARVGGDEKKAAGAKVACDVETPEGRKLTFDLTAQTVTLPSGRTLAGYGMEIAAPTAGMHRAVAWTEIGGTRYESSPYSFVVRPYSPETMPRPASDDTLKAAAAASGGKFLKPEEVVDALRDLQVALQQNERIHYRSLWTNLTMLTVLIGLLCVEWVIRKARNLV